MFEKELRIKEINVVVFYEFSSTCRTTEGDIFVSIQDRQFIRWIVYDIT